MPRIRKALLPTIAVAFTLSGCARAQQSFQTVQMCVDNQRGVDDLKNLMMMAARSEGLEFIDNSAQQAADLKEIGADKVLKRDAAHAIDFHIEGSNGLGATAGNLGLPTYQVGVGFTEGNDPVKAHKLAEDLVRAMSRRWSVQSISPAEGILPMKSCGG